MRVNVRLKMSKDGEWFNSFVEIDNDTRLDEDDIEGAICDALDEKHKGWHRWYKLSTK